MPNVKIIYMGAVFAPGGVASAGANTWYQGGIVSKGGSGGLTIGSASVYSSTVSLHESRHTIIFIGAALTTGASGGNRWDAWKAYGITGVIGLPYGGPGTGDINWF